MEEKEPPQHDAGVQSSGLPSCPEEHGVFAAITTVSANVHATLEDVEIDIETIREHFGATAEALIEEVFPGDAEMRDQRGRADGRVQLLERRV